MHIMGMLASLESVLDAVLFFVNLRLVGMIFHGVGG